MFKHILLATDGSPVVERIILYAAHLARREDAEIIVLHAYELPERYSSYRGYDELIDQYRSVAQALLDEVVQQLREDGVAVQGELRTGAAAEAIIMAAAEHNVDLIIMGTRGSSNITDIIGSVSNQVLSRATCPVLEIP
ncbi:MAG: universal stress protein [Chloroflexaceae bacterium]|nr:universal stress protein [Chloroflexaceae bacterium]NJL33380.1 universal stress protein [Chloroflexaceae bacterium]NJO06019.1 universal stress protein [Chloroflexaceae bacterium]